MFKRSRITLGITAFAATLAPVAALVSCSSHNFKTDLLTSPYFLNTFCVQKWGGINSDSDARTTIASAIGYNLDNTHTSFVEGAPYVGQKLTFVDYENGIKSSKVTITLNEVIRINLSTNESPIGRNETLYLVPKYTYTFENLKDNTKPPVTKVVDANPQPATTKPQTPTDPSQMSQDQLMAMLQGQSMQPAQPATQDSKTIDVTKALVFRDQLSWITSVDKNAWSVMIKSNEGNIMSRNFNPSSGTDGNFLLFFKSWLTSHQIDKHAQDVITWCERLHLDPNKL